MPEPTGRPVGREAEVLAARRESLERLGNKKAFAITLADVLDVSEPTRSGAIRAAHPDLAADAQTDDVVTVAGRVALKRDMGKLVFATLRDRDGDLQIVVNAADLSPDEFALFHEVDLGDIIGATGTVGTTRKGELSVFVSRWAMLTKALRPLPEKWAGLQDPDLQQRRRYLHLIADEEPRKAFLARAAVLKTIRRMLDERGFVEFEGPMLQTVAGGANARPFTTHHHALDIPMKLRISLELYLKRMLVGGLDRVFELGRNFRNEGIDRDHNPEFTMLEAYQAYGDYEDMMELVEALVKTAALAVRGSLRFEYQGREMDLESAWRRVTMLELVSEAAGEDVTLERSDLGTLADAAGVHVDPAWGPGKIVLELYEKLVESELFQPTFVKDFPREVSPLARPHRSSPGLTEHVDLIMAGVEISPSYSELTDPDEQRARFGDQLRQRRAGDEEAHPLDEDFLTALEHGMPPAGGTGLGVDRLVMILANEPSLRDVIAFPHVRPEI
jgi:lysyl-tRNA synthetase, class II